MLNKRHSIQIFILNNSNVKIEVEVHKVTQETREHEVKRETTNLKKEHEVKRETTNLKKKR